MIDYCQRTAAAPGPQGRMRRVVAFLLAVFVALSQMTGAVQAELSASGELQVLCSDLGARVVVIGADGSPVDPDSTVRHCAKCLPLPQPTVLSGAPAVPAAAWSASRVLSASHPAASNPPVPCHVPAARGPPGVS